MQVNIKKLNKDAVVPSYAHNTDAGLDLTATSMESLGGGNICYGTGLAVEIPDGYVGLLFPRSSVFKTGMSLTNSVGVIDSGYRGEMKAVFRDNELSGSRYAVGERVAQLIIMPYPKVEFVVVDELGSSDRGEGGYGSTGR